MGGCSILAAATAGFGSSQQDMRACKMVCFLAQQPSPRFLLSGRFLKPHSVTHSALSQGSPLPVARSPFWGYQLPLTVWEARDRAKDGEQGR